MSVFVDGLAEEETLETADQTFEKAPDNKTLDWIPPARAGLKTTPSEEKVSHRSNDTTAAGST